MVLSRAAMVSLTPAVLACTAEQRISNWPPSFFVAPSCRAFAQRRFHIGRDGCRRSQRRFHIGGDRFRCAQRRFTDGESPCAPGGGALLPVNDAFLGGDAMFRTAEAVLRGEMPPSNRTAPISAAQRRFHPAQSLFHLRERRALNALNRIRE
jgi:hypothetical protein